MRTFSPPCKSGDPMWNHICFTRTRTRSPGRGCGSPFVKLLSNEVPLGMLFGIRPGLPFRMRLGMHVGMHLGMHHVIVQFDCLKRTGQIADGSKSHWSTLKRKADTRTNPVVWLVTVWAPESLGATCRPSPGGHLRQP